MNFHKNLDDEQLFNLIKLGDDIAYKEIYERYFDVLYIHAYKKLQDDAEAQDIVQEVFSILWHKRKEIALQKNLSGYLYTSIRNRIFNYFSHKKVESTYIQSFRSFCLSYENFTDHLVREKELAKIIEMEIQILPPKMREVFELSRKYHLSHQEIAERLNISVKTVKRQVSNALLILRTKLEFMLLIILFLL